MQATSTFQDMQNLYVNPLYGQLQQQVRRPTLQPQVYPAMPIVPASSDNNNFAFADYVRP